MAESTSGSIDTSLDTTEETLNDLPDEELYKMLENILRANDIKKAENQMFEKYLKRVDPLLAAPGGQGGAPGSDGYGSRGNRKRSKSRGSATDRALRLTAEQKCDIAQREIEELREEIKKLSKESEKIVDTYKAIMEEAGIRLGEIRKMYYEFDRDVVRGAVNPRTGKVVAEKLLRYFEDRNRQRETLIEKLRLKNAAFKVQRRKLLGQLRQKEEMGEVLHEVDFQQLKIENQQYLEKIDEKNKELLRLKQMAGSTLQVLNSYKKKLEALNKESMKLKAEITSRLDLIRRVDEEEAVVDEEKSKAETTNGKLTEQLTDFKVPAVMEYVDCVAEDYQLRHKERIWKRKVDIATMAVDRHRKIWQQIRKGAPNSAGY